MNKWLTIAGMGEDGYEGLSAAARQALMQGLENYDRRHGWRGGWGGKRSGGTGAASSSAGGWWIRFCSGWRFNAWLQSLQV